MKTPRACTQTTLQLPWYLTGAIPASERRQVREHLIGCAACRSELAKARIASNLFIAASKSHVSTALEAPGNSPRTAASTSIVPRRVDRWAWAAAAALLIVASSGAIWQIAKDSTWGETSPSAEESRPAMDGESREATPIFADGFDDGGASRWNLKT